MTDRSATDGPASVGAASAGTAGKGARGRRSVVAALLLVVLAGGGALLAYLPRARAAFASLLDVAQAGGWQVWPQFVIVQIAVAAFGVLPASLMAVAAGVAYGLWAGFFLSAAGTMVGGWIAFALSRSVLRPWIARLLARRGRFRDFDEAIAADGWRFVCLMRISPVMPFAATSYGLGLTGVTMRDFLIGTLASLPALFGYVAAGAFGKAGLAFGQAGGGWLRWVLVLVGVAVILLAVMRLQATMRQRLGPITSR